MKEILIDERQATNPAARQILEILDSGQYNTADGTKVAIAEAQAAAEKGTVLYTPERLRKLVERAVVDQSTEPAVEVIDATTQQAGQTLSTEGDVVLLNFASARNPGGGFFGGAQAQEEELCRSSGLYRTLLTQADYYQTHRKNRSLLYSDRIIYSPRVPFFRLSTQSKWLDSPFYCSVITAPAPNAGAIQRNAPKVIAEIQPTFARRWKNILAVGEDTGHRVLLLGAWGCGAFRNDPVMVAETARIAIFSPRFAGCFDRIVFAIPGFNKHSQVNLSKFKEVFQVS